MNEYCVINESHFEKKKKDIYDLKPQTRDLANKKGEATGKADTNLATSQPCVQEPKIPDSFNKSSLTCVCFSFLKVCLKLVVSRKPDTSYLLGDIAVCNLLSLQARPLSQHDYQHCPGDNDGDSHSPTDDLCS